MIDTIKITSSDFNIADFDLALLQNKKQSIDEKTGELKYYEGFYKNFKLVLKNDFISLKGSITKYYLGNNFETLCRKDLEKAFIQLGTALNINLMTFNANRLDISTTFLMDNPAYIYFSHLESLSRCNPIEYFGESKSFSNKCYKVMFYDKALELEKQKKEVKDLLKEKGFDPDMNLLRFEIQVFKVSKFFKRPITVKDMITRPFYNQLIQHWAQTYFDINKKEEISILNFEGNPVIKSRLDYLILKGLEATGKENFINQLKQDYKKGIIKRQSYYGFVNKIKKASKAFRLKNSSILELDNKIKNIVSHCR